MVRMTIYYKDENGLEWIDRDRSESTDKQIEYLKKEIGVDATGMSRSQASKEIDKIIIRKHEEDLKELRIEASGYLEEHPDYTGIITDMPNRSCWECNPGHNHLRNVEYPFTCFECGNTYYKGIDITEDEEECKWRDEGEG